MAERDAAFISCEPDILEWQLPIQVVRALLVDHSTKGNIRWCCSDYEEEFGANHGFGENDEIKAELIVDPSCPVIRPRSIKGKDTQRRRVIEKAEVFTPSWVCNKQNNLVDAAWFGAKRSPFNVEKRLRKNGRLVETWSSTVGPGKKIRFPEGKGFLDYVVANRLEVSCGEAPYLASRYDTVSGEPIPVNDRIGFLDRKLRVISENVPSSRPDIWFEMAKLAVKSVYGFDLQGDNVFLARENILWTVNETFVADLSLPPLPEKSLLELAEIISWNIWQMDGIKFVVPNTCGRQKDLLGRTIECQGCKTNGRKEHDGVRCRVMDWETDKPVLFMPPFDFKPIEEVK